jgi:hypothetical protein
MRPIKNKALEKEDKRIFQNTFIKKRTGKDERLWDKSKKDLEYYNSGLRELAELYFKHKSSNEDKNKELYDYLNNEWKEMVKKVNSLSKTVRLKFDAFETTIIELEKRVNDYKKQPERVVEKQTEM